LQSLRSRKERVESRIPIVFFVGVVIGSNDVQDVVLDTFSCLTAPLDADKTGLQEPTSTREIIPDRNLFGLEHCLEFCRSRARDSENNLRRLCVRPRLLPRRVHGALTIATTAASDRLLILLPVCLAPR